MKKKVLLSSIATIVLCLCLIAGTTFALFTSEGKVDITVTSGKVQVSADINTDSFKGESLVGTDSYTAPKTDDNGALVVTFENGGTATWNASTAELVLDRVTPGDFVTFNVDCANSSNVAIRYRFVVSLVDDPNVDDDTILTSALTVKINGVECQLTDGVYFESAWTELDIDATAAENAWSTEIIVGIDETVGNGYTDGDGNFISYHDRTAKISVVLEAIQGNGFDAEGNPLT